VGGTMVRVGWRHQGDGAGRVGTACGHPLDVAERRVVPRNRAPTGKARPAHWMRACEAWPVERACVAGGQASWDQQRHLRTHAPRHPCFRQLDRPSRWAGPPINRLIKKDGQVHPRPHRRLRPRRRPRPPPPPPTPPPRPTPASSRVPTDATADGSPRPRPRPRLHRRRRPSAPTRRRQPPARTADSAPAPTTAVASGLTCPHRRRPAPPPPPLPRPMATRVSARAVAFANCYPCLYRRQPPPPHPSPKRLVPPLPRPPGARRPRCPHRPTRTSNEKSQVLWPIIPGEVAQKTRLCGSISQVEDLHSPEKRTSSSCGIPACLGSSGIAGA